MSYFDLSISGFGGNLAQVNTEAAQFHASRFELCRAAALVGRRHWSGLFEGGSARGLLDALGRCLQLLAHLDTNGPGYRLSPSFYDLDQSEKSYVSYRLAMTVTKLAYERYLSVPWLIHIDSLIRRGDATLEAGFRSRGDLAGLDHEWRWHVVEVKGRSSAFNAALMLEAKTLQANRVVAISGRPPRSRAASGVFGGETPILVALQDPSSPLSRRLLRLRMSSSSFLRSYYRPLIELLAVEGLRVRDVTLGRSTFHVCAIEEAAALLRVEIKSMPHVQIGVAADIADGLSRGAVAGAAAARTFADRAYPQLVPDYFNSSATAVGADGSLLGLV
jgi:hypothetical protein